MTAVRNTLRRALAHIGDRIDRQVCHFPNTTHDEGDQ